MILVVSAVFPPEPLTSAFIAKEIVEELSRDSEVKVITPKPSRPLGSKYTIDKESDKPYEHIIAHSFTCPESDLIGRMYESFSFGKKVSLFIRKNRCGIKAIYLNSWPLFSQYLIVRESKSFSIPVIIHVQDIYPESLYNKLPLFIAPLVRLLLPIDRYVLNNVAKVVTISQKMSTYLAESRRIKTGNPEIVYNWQDDSGFVKYNRILKKEMDKKEFIFMFLGNINKTSAIDKIITAFEASGLSDSKLIIAGSGSEKEMIDTLIKNSGGTSVELWDAPAEKVPAIQSKADVMIIGLKKGASKFALPSKLASYMFSAKPIIACVDRDTDVAEIIVNTDCGWITPPEDPEKLSELLMTVRKLSCEELHNKGNNGWTFAMQNFSKSQNLNKLIGFIKALN